MKSYILILALSILALSCNSGNESVEISALDTAQSVIPVSDTSGSSRSNSADSETPGNGESNSGDKTKEKSASLTWTKLAAGPQSKMDNRSMFVVNNKTKLDELWNIAFQQGAAPAKPNVDFSKNSVLILFLGQVNSGGHSIEPVSIQTSGDDPLYTITVKHNKPGTNCTTTSVIEYPYYFALTDKFKSEKEEFKVNEVEKKCE